MKGRGKVVEEEGGLVGTDGNVFSLISKVSKALKTAGLRKEAAEFQEKAFASGGYDEVLRLISETVEVY